MDQAHVIWALAKDNFDQARAHETYRANLTTLVITLAGILIGTLSFDLGVRHPSVVYGIVAVLGAYGALASAKHYERFRMHVAIGQHFLKKLEDLGILTIHVNDEFRHVQEAREWRHSGLARLSLNWLWTGLPAALGLAGLLLLILA